MVGRSQVLLDVIELDVRHEVSRVRRRLGIVQEAAHCHYVVYRELEFGIAKRHTEGSL